jgi:hypothetical protein
MSRFKFLGICELAICPENIELCVSMRPPDQQVFYYSGISLSAKNISEKW